MQKIPASIVINEVETTPLSEYVVDFLVSKTKECPFLDFKKIINIGKEGDFAKIVKDVLAFSNYGGGWILIGFSEPEPNRFLPEGLPEEFKADQASIQEKINSYLYEPIVVDYGEYQLDLPYDKKTAARLNISIKGGKRRFGILFIPPSKTKILPKKDGTYVENGKQHHAFKKDQLFTRRGTQSTIPSRQEEVQIEQRIAMEDYRCSILSGQPDQVAETITSNLFEVSKLPSNIYEAKLINNSPEWIQTKLQESGVKMFRTFKFVVQGEKIITFENLFNSTSIQLKIVDPTSVKSSNIADWLADENKRKVVTQLLNRELITFCSSKGMFYFKKKGKLFYPGLKEKPNQARKESWKSRYDRQSTRTVAAKIDSPELERTVYQHLAVSANFVWIDGRFLLRLTPSFVISEDGRHPLAGSDEGRIITKLSYDRYNNSYLNTILFWFQKMSNGKDIEIGELKISGESVTASIDKGILFDVPSSQLKLDDEEQNMSDDAEEQSE